MVVRTGVDPRELSELLTAVAERREGSFEHFYDATSSRVFGLVVRTLRDRRLTEDVVQEVYLQIWEQAPHFDPARGSALSWVLTLAHRRAVDHVRREQSARHRDQHYAAVDHTAVPDHADTVVDAHQREHEGHAVHDCLGDLTSTQRESISLAYYDGLTYREVAGKLDVALPTVKSRIRDGLRRLRDCLGVMER